MIHAVKRNGRKCISYSTKKSVKKSIKTRQNDQYLLLTTKNNNNIQSACLVSNHCIIFRQGIKKGFEKVSTGLLSQGKDQNLELVNIYIHFYLPACLFV